MGKIKKILKEIFPHPLKNEYAIGFLSFSDLALPKEERYKTIRWIKNPKSGWYADPFIVSANNHQIEAFVEEMTYATGKGLLTRLLIDKKTMKVVEKNNLLQLPSHLSYPIFIKENDKLYVYPENYQSGALNIYEYDVKKKKLINPRPLIQEPLLDTQILCYNGTYYAFGVKFQKGVSTDTKVLYIYESKGGLLDEYCLVQTIKNIKCEERGGGLIFVDDSNRIIRPVQSCEGGYGKHIIFKELIYKEGRFEEKEITKLLPDEKAKYGDVLHTFNRLDDLIVIDGHRDFYPCLAKLYKSIRHIDDDY